MQNIDKQKILPFEDVKQMLSLELIFNESSVSGLLVTGHCFITSRPGLGNWKRLGGPNLGHRGT